MNPIRKLVSGGLRRAALNIDRASDRILGMGYDAGESTRFRKDLGWSRTTPRDEDSMVGADQTREWIRLKGADLRRNDPVVAGLCDRLDIFFVGSGVRPQAKTSDPVWNKAAEQFCADWYSRCDVRGMCTMWDLQGMTLASRPTTGGIYFELLDSGQIRPIECERIRQPTKPDQAKGFLDGVKRDSVGRIVGYWVHDRDTNGSFSGEHREGFIPADNMLPVIRRPFRPDQCREIPELSPVIPILWDLKEMNTSVLNTAKVRSSIIGALKRQSGFGSQSSPRNQTTPTVGQRQTWKMDWGQIFELFTNEDIVFPTTNMPDVQHVPFMRLELLLAASAMNLPYDFFTLDFSGLDFSRMKGVLLIVNRVRRVWLRWLNQNMNQRLWDWRIAKAMRPGGELDPAPVDAQGRSEWARVEWQADEEPWIDRQEANQADVLEWQLGLEPLTAAASRRGRDLEDTLNEKARILKMAAKIEVDNNLPPGTLINAQIPGQTPPGAPAKPAPKEETK